MKLSLPTKITSYFPNQATHVVKNLWITTQGIFAAKSTNLNLVKDELGNILQNQDSTQPESNYKRLHRFFQISDREKQEIVKSLLCIGFSILGSQSGTPKYLTLDGTSWELGKKKIHLLTLGIVIKGVSIPICWEELDKKGNSNYGERKSLIEKACSWYNLEGLILLADREYIGEQWFKYLKAKGLNFVIRLKKKIYKENVDQQLGVNTGLYKHQKWRYIGMEREAKKKRYKNVGVAKEIEILGERYSFVIFKNPKREAEEELIYFISTLKNKGQVVKSYPIRWTIECCFKHLKSNGFDLESLNLKKPEKIKMMMAIVCFLYVLCIYNGFLSYATKKKSDWKKYADGKITLAISIFKKGKSILAGKFYHLPSFIEYLARSIKREHLPQWVNVQ